MGNETSQINVDENLEDTRASIGKLKSALNELGDIKAQRKLVLNTNDIDDSEFVFNLDYVIPHAKYVLETDPNIATIRQQIVPAM